MGIRRGFLAVLGLLLCATVAAGAMQFEWGRDVPRDALSKFYSTWFAHPYEYMFSQDDGEGITLNGARYGAFTAGIHGLVYYGGLVDCASKYLGIDRERYDFWDPAPLEDLGRLPLKARLDRDAGYFTYYNPKYIAWWRDTMIPAPDVPLLDTTCGEVYRKVFRRFFRLMTESYLYLKHNSLYEREKKAYFAAMRKKNFEALSYLDGKFPGCLTEYSLPEDGTAMTVPMAMGFWIRRGIDRTDFELWLSLRKVMRLYDGEWFDTLRTTYDKAKYLI